MLVLRGSLQEHLLILLGTDSAHKKCSGMHIYMRGTEGFIYGERLKKLKVPKCPDQMMDVNRRGGKLSDVQIFEVCNQWRKGDFLMESENSTETNELN